MKELLKKEKVRALINKAKEDKITYEEINEELKDDFPIEKIEKNEKSRKMSIPFLSVFVEDLEEEKIETVIKTEEKRTNPLKYLLIMLVLLFLFIAIGKTVQNNGYVKKAKEHIALSEEKFKNKRYKEFVNEIDAAILYYKKISPQNKKTKEKKGEQF